MFWSKKKKDNSDHEGEQNTQGPLYTLELIIEGIDSQEIPIEGDLLIGSSENAHICIEGVGLLPEHATIRLQNNVLSLFNYAEEGSFIQDQQLHKGKSYIIDGGDTLTLGSAKILIKKQGEEEAEELLNETPSSSVLEESLDKQDLSPVEAPPTEEKEEVTSVTRTGLKSLETTEKAPVEKKTQKSAKPLVEKKVPLMAPTKKKNFLQLSSFSIERGPHFFSRFAAFITNLFITYAFVYAVLPVFDSSGHILNAVRELILALRLNLDVFLPVPQELSFAWTHALEFYFLFSCLEIFWALLLGISLPLFLLGVTTDDSFFLKRIKAIIRSALGVFTTPLLIFDLSILIGFKSFKELLSFSNLQYRTVLLKYIGTFVCLPTVCLVCALSPVFIHLENFSTFSLLTEMKEEQDLGFNKKAPKTASTTATASLTEASPLPPAEIVWMIDSEYFGVKAELRFADNLIILPLKGRGVVILDRNKDNVFAEFTKKEVLNFNKLLTSSSDGNPLFFLLFPDLNNYIEGVNKNMPPLPGSEKDTYHLLTGALHLNAGMLKGEDYLEDFMSIMTYMIEYGPFLPGYLNTRDNAVTLLGITQGSTVAFLNQKSRDFIRVSPIPSKIIYTLVSSPDQPHPSYEYSSSHPQIRVGMKVIRQLLNGNWNYVIKPPMTATASDSTKKLTQLEKENAFAAVDYLDNLSKGLPNLDIDNQSIMNYFKSEYERVKDLPASSLLLHKFKESVYNYAQELRRHLRAESIELNQLINEIELIVKNEVPVPVDPNTLQTPGSATETQVLPNQQLPKGTP